MERIDRDSVDRPTSIRVWFPHGEQRTHKKVSKSMKEVSKQGLDPDVLETINSGGPLSNDQMGRLLRAAGYDTRSIPKFREKRPWWKRLFGTG